MILKSKESWSHFIISDKDFVADLNCGLSRSCYLMLFKTGVPGWKRLKEAPGYFWNQNGFRVFRSPSMKLQPALSPRLLEIRTCHKYIKCCIFDFLSDGARPIRAQPHILWKVAKNDIYVASDMARSARGSARAPIKLSKSDLSIKIDAFSLFDHCHSFKTHRDTESWSLVKNWK